MFFFLSIFRSKRLVSTIFPSYIMPSGTSERIKQILQYPPFKTSTHSQILTSRCSQKAPSYPPHIMRNLMVTNALTGSPLGVDRCAIQKKNWPLGWRLIMEKMQESLSKRSSSSTGQMAAGIGPRTLRFDSQMTYQPRERTCSLVASC